MAECTYPHCPQLYGGCGMGCDSPRVRRQETFCGMKVFYNTTVPPDTIEFHHADGRIDRFKLDPH